MINLKSNYPNRRAEFRANGVDFTAPLFARLLNCGQPLPLEFSLEPWHASTASRACAFY
jgi:hypothetical protein